MTNDPTLLLSRLDALETKIAQGITAMPERNHLIAQLVDSKAVTKADIARRLNAIRLNAGAPAITWALVQKTAQRHSRKNPSADVDPRTTVR